VGASAAPTYRGQVRDADFDKLVKLTCSGDVVVLSGAGLSTESGIPDYRGPTGRRHPATPMTFQEFTASPAARQRYWARSHRGWQRIEQAQPNDGHRAVARLQRAGLLRGVITQNVDGLHQAGGAREVIELHGGLNRVICLSCRMLSERYELDERLAAANPRARDIQSPGPVKPDGDVELAELPSRAHARREELRHRAGDRVHGSLEWRSRRDHRVARDADTGRRADREDGAEALAVVEASRLLLVLGSSLTVASGFRFVRRAAARGIPVAIINQGGTRGDPLAEVLLDGPLGNLLPALASAAIG